MNLMRKSLGIALCAVTLPAVAFAHGELWYDYSAHLPQYKKLVIYPVQWPDGIRYTHENENTDIYKLNDHIDTRLVRKLKFKTISLGRTLKENKDLRIDESKYKSLYQNFSSEKERGNAVFDITGAQGYMTPRIYEMRTEPHLSPETHTSVQLKTWTEEENGPNGNRTYNVNTWYQPVTIPAQELMLYHMAMTHDIFNKHGQKVFRYRNEEHTYGESYQNFLDFSGKSALNENNYRLKMFKHLVKEFRKDTEDVRENFKKNQKRQKEATGPIISFGKIAVPNNVGNDEYLINSVYFYLKDAAMARTNARVNTGHDDRAVPARYQVKGTIYTYKLDRSWHPPYADTISERIDKKEQTWTDKDGKKHTMTISNWKTTPTTHHGYWSYTATVGGILALVDTRSGQVVVSHETTETDDKMADAYRHLVNGFYDKVNNYIGNK